MNYRIILSFLVFFFFLSCSPTTKQKSSFSSATSLNDETVTFLPPASDAESFEGGVLVETVIAGEASHVEIDFNGVLVKSCSTGNFDSRRSGFLSSGRGFL